MRFKGILGLLTLGAAALVFAGAIWPNPPSGSAEGRIEAGNTMLARGLELRAEEEYLDAIRSNPYSFPAWKNLGDLYAGLGRLDEAENAYSEAVRLDPHFIPALIELGIVRLRLGDAASALDTFDTLLAVEPVEERALYYSGLALIALDRPAEAESRFRNLLRVSPNDPDANLGLGLVARGRGDLEAAVGYFTAASEYDTFSARPHSLLASAFEAMGREREAMREYRTALGLDTNRHEDAVNLDRLMRGFGEYRDAAATVRSYGDSSPGAFFAEGVDMELAGDLDGAKAAYLSALNDDPEDEVILYRYEEVVSSTDTAGSSVRVRLARRHLDAGRREFRRRNLVEAFRQFKRAVRIAPQFSEARLALARFYEDQGFYTNSLEELSRVQELTRSQGERLEAEDLAERIARRVLRETEDVTGADLSDLIERPTADQVAFILSGDEFEDRLGWSLGPLPRPEVAFAVFDPVEVSDPYHAEAGEVMGDFIRTTLSLRPGYSVLPRSRIARARRDLGLDGVTDLSKALAVARRLDADLLVYSEITETRDDVRLTVRLVEVSGQRTLLERRFYTRGPKTFSRAATAAVAAVHDAVPLTGRILHRDGDLLYINLGRLHGLTEGTGIDVFRDMVETEIPGSDLERRREEILAAGSIEAISEVFARVRVSDREDLLSVRTRDWVRAGSDTAAAE